MSSSFLLYSFDFALFYFLSRYTGVPYCQHQNSNFTTDFAFLNQDAGSELPFASEAFGTSPDAINFWMVRMVFIKPTIYMSQTRIRSYYHFFFALT